jgi:predicted nucleotidyltransferase
VREKDLTVFSLYSPAHLATEVDVFVQSPFDFSGAYERAARIEVAPGIAATFVGFDDLIALKRHAGRPQDALDIQQLNALQKDGPDDPS